MDEESKPAGGAAEHAHHTEAPYHNMSAGQYLKTRISSLKPPMTKVDNPIRLIRSVTRMQWAFFSVAFVAWVSTPFLVPSL